MRSSQGQDTADHQPLQAGGEAGVLAIEGIGDDSPKGNLVAQRLITTYMAEYGLTQRPFVKDVIESLLADVQQARIIYGALELDTFAQTERVGHRPEITVNTRIHEMENVNDAALIVPVALFHESVHIDVDFVAEPRNLADSQPTLPGLGAELPRLIMCRRHPHSSQTRLKRGGSQ